MEFMCCSDISCCGELGLRCDGCLQRFGELCNCKLPTCTACLDSICPTKEVITLYQWCCVSLFLCSNVLSVVVCLMHARGVVGRRLVHVVTSVTCPVYVLVEIVINAVQIVR